MRAHTPTLHCDDESGCDRWDVDFYATTADSVNGVKITASERAPGWTETEDGEDRCPEHRVFRPGEQS